MTAAGYRTDSKLDGRPVWSDAVRMVDFAAQWVAFDGGDEYILPEFGVDPTTYYRRVLTILQTPPSPPLDPEDRQRIVERCQRKLTPAKAHRTV